MYKLGPKLYRMLQGVFKLPTERTILSTLNKIPFDTGLNQNIKKVLLKSIKNMNNADKFCSVLFNEISIKPNFQFDRKKDRISGFVDYGNNEREPKFADHCTTFILRGIKRKWKQPILYYFVQSGMPCPQLN